MPSVVEPIVGLITHGYIDATLSIRFQITHSIDHILRRHREPGTFSPLRTGLFDKNDFLVVTPPFLRWVKPVQCPSHAFSDITEVHHRISYALWGCISAPRSAFPVEVFRNSVGGGPYIYFPLSLTDISKLSTFCRL